MMRWKKNFNPVDAGRRLFHEFEQGHWFREAQSYLADKKRLDGLLGLVARMFNNGALASVLKDLLLLYHYVNDISHGRYKAYNPAKLILIVALLIYVVTPIDIIPDWLPGIGFLDDVALLGYVMRMVGAELQTYYSWVKKQSKDVK